MVFQPELFGLKTYGEEEVVATKEPVLIEDQPVKDWESINNRTVALRNAFALANATQSDVDFTLVEVIRQEVSEEVFQEVLEGTYSADDLDWQRISEVAGYGDWVLLKAFYVRGNMPRNAAGYPDSEGKTFPWYFAAAIPSGESNMGEWGTTNPREVGPWGKSNAYEACTSLGRYASACQEGVVVVAESLGIPYEEIKGSRNGALGRTQVMPFHFRSGGIYAGLLESYGKPLDVWNDPELIAEVTLIHLIRRGCSSQGGSWYTSGSLTSALCGYNPNAWGVSAHQWYFDLIPRKANDIEAAFVKVHEERPSQTKLLLPTIATENLAITQVFGTYPYTQEFIDLGIAGSFHPGVDLGNYTVFNIRTVGRSRVVSLNTHANYGSQVTFELLDMQGCQVTYMHTGWSSISHLQEGQELSAGEEFGRIGANREEFGKYATGAHLHFELRCDGKPVDAELYFDTALPHRY